MVRKLKYHEQKLLKKVDFITWKSDKNIREIKIIRKYHLQKREDYTKYGYRTIYGMWEVGGAMISWLDKHVIIRGDNPL